MDKRILKELIRRPYVMEELNETIESEVRIGTRQTAQKAKQTEDTTVRVAKVIQTALENFNTHVQELILTVMLEINGEVEKLKKRVDDLEEKVNKLTSAEDPGPAVVTKDKNGLQETIRKQQQQIKRLENNWIKAEEEKRSKNIIIYQLPFNESLEFPGTENAMDTAKKFLREKLKLDGTNYNIERAFRLRQIKQGQAIPPLLIQFSNTAHKFVVLRNCYQLKGTRISVQEDIPPQWRAARKELLKKYREFKNQKKKVFFRADKLIVNGKEYHEEEEEAEIYEECPTTQD